MIVSPGLGAPQPGGTQIILIWVHAADAPYGLAAAPNGGCARKLRLAQVRVGWDTR